MFWLVISECASVDPALYKETSVTSSPVLWPKPCMLRAKQESVQTSTCTLTVSKRVEFCDFGFDWGKVVLHGDLFVLHRPVMDYRYSVLLSARDFHRWKRSRIVTTARRFLSRHCKIFPEKAAGLSTAKQGTHLAAASRFIYMTPSTLATHR
eukprot:TRINITY_DN3195_c0_g1_i2.p1 TRINITY_DN3195_c0_g1~~TRINITY_DN3195_c0_g1_i2.p1  ORF type:complete len:152 (-),score=10.58 TRINITY_DN3195_c0_g1_i2:488-943(-)